MTAAAVESANDGIRAAVRERMAATPADDPKMVGYGAETRRVHPSSQMFFDLCDALKEMHASKSRDYGSEKDALANIRNGAAFVRIEPWRAAMVRLSDKVTRLATYCRTGTLSNETVEDSLLDLASYSLLALILHREQGTS